MPFLKDSSTCRIFVLALLGIIFNFILVPFLEDYVFSLELVATFISFYSMASLLNFILRKKNHVAFFRTKCEIWFKL